MEMRREMRGALRALMGVCVAGAAVLGGPAPVLAQDPSLASGWQAWHGCWEPVGAPEKGSSTLVCVTPATGASAVTITTIVDQQVASTTQIDAMGTKRAIDTDGCTGWERVQWSGDGQRIYLESELTCEGGPMRSTSGVLAMTPKGEWLDVQGIAAGESHAVRVVRYREAKDPAVVIADFEKAVAEPPALSAETARLAAAARLDVEDVIEASQFLGGTVIEAWLAELGQGFDVDAKSLVALDDAGVPEGVIDMMVALSFPKVFAIKSTDGSDDFIGPIDYGRRGNEMPPAQPGSVAEWLNPFGYGVGPDGYTRDRFGYNYGYGYGYGAYGYGWYPRNRPIIVIVQPPQQTEKPEQPQPVAKRRPRVVNGRGYTRDDRRRDPDMDRTGRVTEARSTSPSSSSSAGSSSASSSSESKRTAKPRSSGGGSR